MNRIAMVSINKIVEVAKRNSKPIGEELDYFTPFYETGMKEVLREMALKRLIEIEHTLQPKSKEYNEASDAALLTFNSLHEKLCNENEQSALMDLEAAYNLLTAFETEEHFIRGYLEGYKFIKESSC
jgi:predicted nucleotide-binding protein (sugar kinase/HSP70/actin superfamily)